MITIEGKDAAAAKYSELIRAAETELNGEQYRIVGGSIDVILEQCRHLIGDGDIIRFTTIKRPLHSPCAMVCER